MTKLDNSQQSLLVGNNLQLDEVIRFTPKSTQDKFEEFMKRVIFHFADATAPENDPQAPQDRTPPTEEQAQEMLSEVYIELRNNQRNADMVFVGELMELLDLQPPNPGRAKQ